MTTQIRPIVLCGGAGTRLWPVSRKSFPKQFAPLIGGKSLLQLTLERVKLINADVTCVQMHHHRAERWIVVKGTARVTREDETFRISENQSTYIPLGIKHRLENPGKVDLEIMEVQSGACLEEDDIVRLEDNYGRHLTVEN